MRVFMCTAGTRGFTICAISEMPAAQNLPPEASDPGMVFANSGANSP